MTYKLSYNGVDYSSTATGLSVPLAASDNEMLGNELTAVGERNAEKSFGEMLLQCNWVLKRSEPGCNLPLSSL